MDEGYDYEYKPEPLAYLPALNRQIGGSHYKKYKIQPAEYMHANEIPFLEGEAISYITRWRDKNGIPDLRKAIHILEILIQLEEAKKKNEQSVSAAKSAQALVGNSQPSWAELFKQSERTQIRGAGMAPIDSKKGD